MGRGMGIVEKAKEIAEIIKKKHYITIVAHADADGVAAAAIAKLFLEENGIEHEIKFTNHIEEELLNEFRSNDILFVDLGNSSINAILNHGINAIIVDHHFSNDFFPNSLNPFHYGIDGGEEISASGLMYLIAKEHADIALIGAAGDLQDRKGFIGLNGYILKNSNVVERNDIRLYGRNLPLPRMLSFSPLIPPFFKNFGMSVRFLKNIGIDTKKSWNELNREEKKALLSSMVKMMAKLGYEKDDIMQIYGKVYELNGYDLREIAAGINSMAKYEKYEEAIHACINGDYNKMKKFMVAHRKNIKDGIKIAKQNLNERSKIKYFIAGKKIKDTILGTITGMLLEGERIEKPLVGMVENGNGIKISVRAPKNMNINLSIAIARAAIAAGGDGGGHKMAAGAMIPKGSEEEFLKFFEAEIANQSPSL